MPVVKVDDIKIAYTERGRGEVVMLIMGLGAVKESWFLNIPTLSKYFRVIAMNSRGVGKISRMGEAYTMRRMAQDTVGLLDALNIERAHIVGVSLGSMIAQEVAISFPQRVNKLILAATTPGMNDTANKEMWDKKNAELNKSTGLGEDFNRRIMEDPASVDAVKVMVGLTKNAFNRPVFRIPMTLGSKYYFNKVGPSGVLDQLRAVSTHNTIDRLNQIKSPTLVMAGTDDKIVPIELSRIVAQHIPGAKLIEFQQGSHSFFMEMSKRFNREVIDFLKG
ncbi:MAG: alpha/beta hydrolase [Dehalococcoidia bacterium]|jgi:pimeloyl-ACP methyl ester carboxylesterase